MPRNAIIESELMGLIELVRGWIRAGLRADQIAERLAAPGDVARDLIDRAVARRKAGAEFMGRDAGGVVAKVETAVRAKVSRRKRKSKAPE